MGNTQFKQRQLSIDDALTRLSRINFCGVRMKLADPIEGKGWDDSTLDQIEGEYRRFLALNYAYPDKTIVPDTAVDEFWHQHILDTRAYAEDRVGSGLRFCVSVIDRLHRGT